MKPALLGGIASLIFFPVLFNAQSLDPDFGNAGTVVTDFDGDYDQAFEGAIDYAGRIITMGRIYIDADWHSGVQRLLPDGEYDASFGSGGLVELFDFSLTNAFAVGPDGKVLLGGATTGTDGTIDIHLVRLNEDGSMDSGFGDSNGLVLSVQADIIESCFSLAVQSDGKILVGGFTGDFMTSPHLLIRLDADGAPDDSFGDAGVVSLPQILDHEYASQITSMTDGSIYYLVEGPESNVETGLIIKLDSSGQPVSDFGNGGVIQLLDEGYTADPASFEVLPDGSVLVAGVVYSGGLASGLVMKFLPNGSPDTDFGNNGIATISGTSNVYMYQTATLADGSIVVMGVTDELTLVKLNSDGAIDSSFGSNGFWLPEPTNLYDSAVSIDVVGDNSIMLMGSGYSFMADFFNAKVIMDEANAVQNEDLPGLMISPNPAQDMIQIFAESNEEILVEIYDMTGRPVISQILLSGNTVLDVTALSNGKYEVMIKGKSVTSVSSLIIQR